MQGVPYIEVSASNGGTNITWDGSNAGEEASRWRAQLVGSLNITENGSGYTGYTPTAPTPTPV